MPRLGILPFATLVLSVCAIPAQADDSIDPRLAPFYQPPEELKDDFGSYRSPLKFDDGRTVSTPAEWQERRQEILRTWHGLMGAWPPLLEKPKIEYLACGAWSDGGVVFDEKRANVNY